MQLFFEPKSVVLIGVSRKSGPGALNNLEMMLRYGYEGRIDLVHPKVSEILGIKTYSRVSDLPECPDLAIISVGRDRVLPIVSECAQRGIRRVIVISQGFADADERGKELQDALTSLAHEHGIRVVGPNTMGILNAFKGFSTAFIDIDKDPAPPPLSMVVQSGVFQVGFESFTGRLGKAIDVGNSSDVDTVDVLEYLENDPETRVIFLHMEGMKRGREFLRVAARVSRHKPIIILKTGRSEAGARAALSHTGSLVGEDAVFEAAFAKAGLIRVRNMLELLAVTKAFLHFDTLSGPRVGVVTATGACGIMTADACEDYGLELAPFPEALADELENPHIAWHKLHNPVDLWPLGMVSGSFSGVFKQAVRGLLKADGVDAVLGIAPALRSPLHGDIDMPAALREVNAENAPHKPIAMWLYGGDEDQQEKALRDLSGVACFGSIDEAVMGLSALWRYEKVRKDTRNVDQVLGPLPTAQGTETKRLGALPPGKLLVGESAMELLKPYGIPIVSGKMTQNVESALAFAGEAEYPVVLKIISPQWLHKSDGGGIRLHVAHEAELRKSYTDLRNLFHEKTPTGTLEGILVQKQLRGTELLMGIKKDLEFGSLLVVGMGGIYTEVFRDVVRMLVPIDLQEAETMLRSLRLFPILKGVRGESGVDLPDLARTIVSLSRLAMDYPEIQELDLNPVLANSEGCWCVDSRIVLEGGKRV